MALVPGKAAAHYPFLIIKKTLFIEFPDTTAPSHTTIFAHQYFHFSHPLSPGPLNIVVTLYFIRRSCHIVPSILHLQFTKYYNVSHLLFDTIPDNLPTSLISTRKSYFKLIPCPIPFT